MDTPEIFRQREVWSQNRLAELSARIAKTPQVEGLGKFTIFSAGSYARHEASQYSDIDLFFLWEGARTDHDAPRTSELRLFGALIEIVEAMDFPQFSNDAQYLSALASAEISEHLGSPDDDHKNFFTLRMLMLLESKCLYGEDSYDRIVRDIIESYYRDYPDHQATFEPWFLLNDIGRFWKTLLLNYENKRNPGGDDLKHKVRNFKLKFSRMTTCFATVAALGSHEGSPVNQEQVFELVKMTPRERLERVASARPDTTGLVEAVLDDYAWFLTQTGLSEEELLAQFADKSLTHKMFERANSYGDRMFELLAAIDRGESRFLRFLVI